MNAILLRKVRRDLLSRKASLLTLVLIVSIGVGCFVGTAALFRDLTGARDRYYRNYRLADFSVDAKRIPEWALEEVRELPNVSYIEGRVSVGALIDLPDVSQPVTGTALSLPGLRRPVLNDVLLRSGTWFSGTEAAEVILNDGFARANNLRPGDRISVLLPDRQHQLLVVGTAMSPEFVYMIPPAGGLAPDPARFGVMYMPAEFLRRSSDLEGAWNQLQGLAFDTSPVPLGVTLKIIGERLDSFGVTNTTPAIEQTSVRFLEDEITGLKVSMSIMPSIFLGVAALILNVLISRLVVQQRTIIGTLKAIGYSRGSITRHFLCYGLVVGIIGGIGGLLIGWAMQASMCSLYIQFYALPAIDPHLYPDILAFGIMVSVAFSLLGTIKGVRHAARLEPAESMRPPPPEKAGRTPIEAIPWLWKKMSFRWKMVSRDIFRNPFRSMVGIVAAAVSTALILTTFSMLDALNYLIEFEFQRVSRQDMTVVLRDPVNESARAELANLSTVSMSELQLSVVCDLSNGLNTKRIGLTGLPPDNRLHTPRDSQGNAIAIPDEGLVLTKKLAEILDVEIGDLVRMRPLIAQRREVTAPVVSLVDSYWGLSSYLNISYLSQLLGEEVVANALLVTSFGRTSEDVLYDELTQRPSVVGIGRRQRTLDQINETFGASMGAILGVLILFAGSIAFGSVLNASLVSVSEREREIGTLRVLGYSVGDVARIFSRESLLLNGLGIALGVWLGIGLSHLVSLAYNTELYRFPTVIYSSRIVASALIMLVFVMLAQFIILRILSRLEWLNALKIKE